MPTTHLQFMFVAIYLCRHQDGRVVEAMDVSSIGCMSILGSHNYFLHYNVFIYGITIVLS